jgi:hypothetical protein
VAVPDLFDHLEVEHRPLVQALRLEQPSLGFEHAAPPGQLLFDRFDRSSRPLARRHEVRFRIHGNLVVLAQRLTGQRVKRRQLVHLVAEQLDAEALLFVRRNHFYDVAAHAEGAAVEVVIVALVLDFHQLAQDFLTLDPLAAFERQQHPVVRLGRTEPVDARHAGDDDDVAALEERSCRRQPHPIDLVVDRRFFLDVRVGRRDVGLRLVVVVVADEVLDGVFWEKAAELLEELGGERLVVHHHQRGAVHAGDGLRHREGLARAGDAEQHLVLVAAV